jgi:hypothetical protein
MPNSGYFDKAFGVDGTRATVPDSVQSDGSVSYDQGFGVDYTLPNTNPSYKYMPQDKFNQLFFDITSAIQTIQQGSAPAFITSLMNGGTPFSYPINAAVTLGGVTYISNTGSNTDTPPSSKWSVYTLSGSNFFVGGQSTGPANAQVLASLSPATGFSLSSPGDTISFTVGTTNTGPATMAVTTPAISATAIQKNSGSGLVALSGGEMVGGNLATLTVSAAGTLVLDAGLPASLFLQKANNLSDVANAATARGNLSAAKSGANTDITSLQGAALIVTPLGVGSMITAICTSNPPAGTTVAASTLTACCSDESGTFTGDALTGTWAAEQTSVTNYCVSFQRIA